MLDLYDYPIVVEIPVAWGEMDYFHHVNNTVYFRYFESARVKYVEAIKIEEYMAKTGMGPILGSTSAKFLAPLKYPDTISIGIKSVKLDSGRIVQEYGVWSHETSRLVAKGESTMVFFDYKKGRPCDIPEGLRENILKLEPYLAETNKSTETA
ncbi:MAG: thioesterase [Oceanospirillaceae bacterium]|uniref:acyl-CoA thioesterase n=1 Tax=Thalassolituus sp. UBA3500 TaxID=1947664 RepID=UPI000C0C5E7A|nr:thioesterase family protein [Thalassolituus sp. UBA3500]MAE34693.1 thioesterase [Oceanospirillaceae bacterium]MBN56765.1 thioesterase [Oceanospirillaceae bacterium]|tara:strand:+ start:368 stop:826 length:459 start_codon:yes stop_codon:yes gene_type:complete